MKYLDHQDLISQITTRSSERKLFQEFLDSEDSGTTVADRLYDLAKQETIKLTKKGKPEISKSEVEEAIIRKYRQNQGTSGLSTYDELIFDLIAVENNKRALINKIKNKKITLSNLPDDFPGMRKQAEILFRGKISSDIKPNDYLIYNTEKQYASILRGYARDLFFAVNGGGSKKEILNFLHLLFSFRQIETSDPITPQSLRKTFMEHLMNGEPLEIVHIKSVRFTYPGGINLKILENTAQVIQPGLDGEIRKYPSEEVIFKRIDNLKQLFANSNIETRVTVIISEHDLDYCFPIKQNIVPNEDIERGRLAAKNYVENLRKLHPEIESIRSLTEFLQERNLVDKFATIFRSLVKEGEQGGGRFISEKILEMRVNEQYEHYSQMFGSYCREMARQTAILQISNLLSLSVVFESFPSIPLLTIDSRGFEDNLIGGYNPESVVKFFTKLKDPTEMNYSAVKLTEYPGSRIKNNNV